MTNFVNHALDGGRILKLTRFVHFVETQPDQGGALIPRPSNRATGLSDFNGPCFLLSAMDLFLSLGFRRGATAARNDIGNLFTAPDSNASG